MRYIFKIYFLPISRQYTVVLPSQNHNSFCIAIQLFSFLKQTRNVPNFWLIKNLALATSKELYTHTEHAIRFSASPRITWILIYKPYNSLQKLKEISSVYLSEVFQTTEQRQNRYAFPKWTLFHLNLTFLKNKITPSITSKRAFKRTVVKQF